MQSCCYILLSSPQFIHVFLGFTTASNQYQTDATTLPRVIAMDDVQEAGNNGPGSLMRKLLSKNCSLLCSRMHSSCLTSVRNLVTLKRGVLQHGIIESCTRSSRGLTRLGELLKAPPQSVLLPGGYRTPDPSHAYRGSARDLTQKGQRSTACNVITQKGPEVNRFQAHHPKGSEVNRFRGHHLKGPAVNRFPGHYPQEPKHNRSQRPSK